MRFYTVLLVLCLCFVSRLEAQFSDSVAYYTGFTSTGTYNRTNLNSNFLLNNSLKLSAKKKALHYNFLNKWLYGEQNEKLSNNDYSSMLDINLHKTFPRFNYWGLFNYTHSYSLKIRNQYQAGLGVAYNLIERKNMELNISDGFIYDYSDIILPDSTRELYGTWRNSFRIRFKGNIKNILTFNANGFYQPSIEYANDYIIKTDVTLGVKIRKWLSFTATFTYNEMSRTRAQNIFMNYGLTVERYF